MNRAHETLIGGSGAHGEAPTPPNQERGPSRRPMNPRQVIWDPEEGKKLREQLATLRAQTGVGLEQASAAYASEPAPSPVSVDEALAGKFRRHEVIVSGTPEGDRFQEIWQQVQRQPAEPRPTTQRSLGIVQRFRNLFT